MAVEHKDIAEVNLHEPKGVSAAAIGEVYEADGAGSGAWTPKKSAQMDTLDASLAGKGGYDVVVNSTATGFEYVPAAGSLFGSVYFNSNAIATPIASSATYYILDPGVWGTSVTDTITWSANKFTVPNDGVYELSMALSFIGGGGGAGNIYRFAFFKNGALIATAPVSRRQAGSGDIGSISLSTMQHLAANDDVEIYVQNESATNNPTVTDASFTIVLLREG